MTWSVQSTLSSTTAADCVREVLDNYVSGLTNFDVATPASNANARNVRINITGSRGIYAADYCYYTLNATQAKINGLYNSNSAATWQDHVYSGSGGMTLGGNPTGAAKLWVSSESPGSFMIVDSLGKVIWGFIDFDIYASHGDGVFNTVASGSTLTGCPLGFASDNSGYSGYPSQNSTNFATPSYMYVDFDSTSSGPNPTASGYIVRGLRFQSASSTTWGSGRDSVVGIVNNTDILLHTGASDQQGWRDSNPLQKVTDGTNWYLRTSATLAHGALLFPVGLSEPTF